MKFKKDDKVVHRHGMLDEFPYLVIDTAYPIIFTAEILSDGALGRVKPSDETAWKLYKENS